MASCSAQLEAVPPIHELSDDVPSHAELGIVSVSDSHGTLTVTGSEGHGQNDRLTSAHKALSHTVRDTHTHVAA